MDLGQGRVFYVEPNDIVKKNHTEWDNIVWNPEDYAIDVDLQIVVPNRTDYLEPAKIETPTSVFIADRNISLFKGKLLNNGDKRTFFTTDYTDASYLNIKLGNESDNECLYIKSIDINFDSDYYPTVVIKFVDVRGYSLMMPGEENQEHRDFNNFYQSFFHLPYPRFILSVKGYYGDKVTFILSMYDFNSELNSASGDIEITANFIGSMYGLYSDIPFSLLLVAPYIGLDGGETNDYWNSNLAERFTFTDGQPMCTMLDYLVKFNEVVKNISTFKGNINNKKANLDKESENLDRIKEHYNVLRDRLRLLSDDSTITTYNGLEYVTITDDGTTNLTINTIISEFYTDIKEYETKLDTTITVRNREEFTDNGGVLVRTTESAFGSIVVNKYLIELNLDRAIDERKREIENETKTLEDDAYRIAEARTAELLGFTPNVENIYRLLFAHLDCFMHYFYSMLKGIKDKTNRKCGDYNITDKNSDIGRKYSENDTIPPFIAVYDEDKGRSKLKYPGDDPTLSDLDEVNFVSQIIDATIYAVNRHAKIENFFNLPRDNSFSDDEYTGDKRFNEIILHCTASKEGKDLTVDDVRKQHIKRGWKDIGYNYLIRLDGKIEKGRSLTMAGSHCKGHNSHSIGICYVGGLDSNGKAKDTRTKEQKESLLTLVNDLLTKYNLTIENVHCHYEYAKKACPCFDIKDFVAEYRNFMLTNGLNSSNTLKGDNVSDKKYEKDGFDDEDDAEDNEKTTPSSDIKPNTSNSGETEEEEYNTDDGATEPTATQADVSKEMKLATYLSLKSMFDKWLCSTSEKKFILDGPQETRQRRGDRFTKGTIVNDNTNSEFDNFIFIDSFYNDISDDFTMNPETLYKIINEELENKKNYSFYNVISKVASENNLRLISTPIFNNFTTKEGLREIFTPFNFYDGINHTTNIGNTYVLMYQHEPSHHIGDKNSTSSDYDDDGFDIVENGTLTPVADGLFGNVTNDKGISFTVPAFAVTYGRQSQSYFTNVSVNTDSPKITDNVIYNLLRLSRGTSKGDVRAPYATAQDMFSIYSNRSFECNVDMMGCANITPMMYFQLNNLPMFRGAYQIYKVTHHIERNAMTTSFKGIRVSKSSMPYNKDVFNLTALLSKMGLEPRFSRQGMLIGRGIGEIRNYPYDRGGEDRGFIDTSKIVISDEKNPYFGNNYKNISKENAKIGVVFMDYLIKNYGYTVAGAAGVIGNSWIESSFILRALNPDDAGKRSIGLFQFRADRANNLENACRDYETNWKCQLDFAMNEKENNAPERCKTQQDPERSAVIWMQVFERCQGYKDENSREGVNRKAAARQLYWYYNNANII